MKTLLLIDGNGVMHRAYHALPLFKTKSGFPTNAMFGFFSILYKVIKDYHPDYLIVCFDTPVPSFRKKVFKEYQAQRPKVEDELAVQFKVTKEALDKAGITHIEKEGFEADDLIGTLVKRFQKEDLRILILSGDRDILQLINKNVYVITPQIGYSKSKIYDEQEVIQKFNVKPEQITDFKALVGDPSDNYSGAKGIGPKIAGKLINEYQSIDNIYKNLEKIPEKIRTILQENKENVYLSLQLAKILSDAPIENINLDEVKFDGFHPDLKDFLLKYEIKSITERIFNHEKNPIKEKTEKKVDQSQISLF
jgi:DNA polymerase-1